MEVRPVVHYNKIGHEINQSIQDYPDSDREIFCRKLHNVSAPNFDKCNQCPYFWDSMGAHGIACKWDDMSQSSTVVVAHANRYKELLRVSKLIDQKIIPAPDTNI